MSTWKPIAALIATVALLTVTAAYGVNHQTGLPNGLGYALLAALAVGGLIAFRHDT